MSYPEIAGLFKIRIAGTCKLLYLGMIGIKAKTIEFESPGKLFGDQRTVM